MSSRYNPVRTNRTPWMDDITLINITKTTDEDGYEKQTTTSRTVCCTFVEGINRNEFYEALKAGIRCTASAELWKEDFRGEEKAEFNGNKYSIVRAYETGRGTVELSLTEEIR